MTSAHRRIRTAVLPALALASLLAWPYGPAFSAGTEEPAETGYSLPIDPGSGGSSGYGSFLAGLIAENWGDYSAAADFMMEALARDPQHDGLLLQTFVLNAAEGRMDRAFSLARSLQERAIPESGALLALAVEALAEDDPGAARELLAQQPETLMAMLTRPLLDAWLAAAMGEEAEALGLLDSLEAEAGLGTLVALHRMMLLDVVGREEEALATADALLARGEQPSLRLVWLIGNLMERHGRVEEAEALYEDFAAHNPETVMLEGTLAALREGREPAPYVADARSGFAQALFDFASIIAQEQAAVPALMHARLALHLLPDLTPAQILIGEILQYQERHREALQVYDGIPADSPFAWNAGLRVADELERLGREEEAVERLRALAEERPERYEPLYRLGNLLRSSERFEEAAEAYGEAIARVSSTVRRHWVLYYFRGISNERSDRWEAAEEDFLTALELEPEQPYVMNYLAYSWVEQERNLEEAEAMLIRAVEREPNDGHIVDSLGWVYYRLGRYEEAVGLLEQAVALLPHDPVINDHLGDAYWRSGRKREAEVQWRRALSLDPPAEEIEKIELKLEEGLGQGREPI